MNTVVSYVQEVRAELAKVVWPKRDQVVKLPLIVLLISAIVGAYLGVLDFAFTKLLELVITR